MWLENFKINIKQEGNFYEEMHAQLSKSFQILTSLELDKFKLLPPFPSKFEFRKINNFSVVAADLLGKTLAYQVEIAWYERDNKFIFWWYKLPFDIIVADEAKQIENSISSHFDFTISLNNNNGSHLKIQFISLNQKSNSSFDKIHSLIVNSVEKWNENHENSGVIHKIRSIDLINNKCIEMTVDLGSASQLFLVELFRKIDAKLKLEQIIIENY